jgi:hypothetical protein
LGDRKNYSFEKEIELAAIDLDKIESPVQTAQIQILAHNHSPWTIQQCIDAMTEAPGMLEQYSQPGRLLIDNVRQVFEEFIAQELAVRYQRRVQQEQMEVVKKSQEKLVLAPAGTFDK